MSIYNSSILPSGLQVLTYNMPGAESVAVNLVAKVGSRYETAHENGISHFLEHMAFKGTSKRSARDIAEEFDTIGGQFNAYTSKELTVYYAKTLAEDVEIAVSILSDIIQNSLYRAEDIAKEYQVICQEIAQTQDSPDDLASELLYSTAFGNTPLGRSILGTAESIAAIDHDFLKKYIRTHYTANNLCFAAAGKIEHEELCVLAEKYFWNILPEQTPYIAEKANYHSGYNYLHKDLEQSVVMVGFESPSYHDLEAYYSAQLLSVILGGGLSSRLFQKIREDLGLAYSVGSFKNSYSDTGLFCLYAGTSHDKVEKVIEQFQSSIVDISTKILPEELARAKSQVRANIIMAEEKPSYKAEDIARQKIIYDRYIPYQEILAKVVQMNTDDLTKVAQQIFTSKPTLSVVSNGSASADYAKLYSKLLTSRTR